MNTKMHATGRDERKKQSDTPTTATTAGTVDPSSVTDDAESLLPPACAKACVSAKLASLPAGFVKVSGDIFLKFLCDHMLLLDPHE